MTHPRPGGSRALPQGHDQGLPRAAQPLLCWQRENTSSLRAAARGPVKVRRNEGVLAFNRARTAAPGSPAHQTKVSAAAAAFPPDAPLPEASA